MVGFQGILYPGDPDLRRKGARIKAEVVYGPWQRFGVLQFLYNEFPFLRNQKRISCSPDGQVMVVVYVEQGFPAIITAQVMHGRQSGSQLQGRGRNQQFFSAAAVDDLLLVSNHHGSVLKVGPQGSVKALLQRSICPDQRKQGREQ